jgi:hypothetical protein
LISMNLLVGCGQCGLEIACNVSETVIQFSV